MIILLKSIEERKRERERKEKKRLASDFIILYTLYMTILSHIKKLTLVLKLKKKSMLR